MADALGSALKALIISVIPGHENSREAVFRAQRHAAEL
jgi:hypothetical protein